MTVEEHIAARAKINKNRRRAHVKKKRNAADRARRAAQALVRRASRVVQSDPPTQE